MRRASSTHASARGERRTMYWSSAHPRVRLSACNDRRERAIVGVRAIDSVTTCDCHRGSPVSVQLGFVRAVWEGSCSMRFELHGSLLVRYHLEHVWESAIVSVTMRGSRNVRLPASLRGSYSMRQRCSRVGDRRCSVKCTKNEATFCLVSHLGVCHVRAPLLAPRGTHRDSSRGETSPRRPATRLCHPAARRVRADSINSRTPQPAALPA